MTRDGCPEDIVKATKYDQKDVPKCRTCNTAGCTTKVCEFAGDGRRAKGVVVALPPVEE